jgi:hypothetical protein
MKKLLVVSAIAVVVSLLCVPLSAAMVPQRSIEPVQITKGTDKSPFSVTAQKTGTNNTLLIKLWNLVFRYRFIRLLLCFDMYAKHPTKLMGIRLVSMTEKVLDWVKFGLLLGIVDPVPLYVDITFVADPVARTITASEVNTDNVKWSYIAVMGNVTFNPFPTGYVTAGDQITNCSGNFTLLYITGATLFTYDFGNQTRF